MPAPEPDFLVTRADPPIRVALEPAINALNSLLLLVKADRISGLDEWVARAIAALPPDQRRRNVLVMNGLYYAVCPDQSRPSFPAYIDHLAAQDPLTLRNRVLNAYAQVNKHEECGLPPALITDRLLLDPDPILANVDAFLGFLRQRFPEESIDPEIESAAYGYLMDPPAMRALIVSHLRSMWEQILSPEWERVLPMLQASVEAFQQLDLGSQSKYQAAHLVLGREPDAKWQSILDRADRVVFVPSAHVGPYHVKFEAQDTLWVLFGARVPEGAIMHAPDLSRAEILVRLTALADDTRLRILQLVAQEGEQRSSDIMERLDLTQSTASRHLTQLAATGYLHERRCEGAKCYTLGEQRIEDTLRALSLFLLGK
ncbi:MAG: winged helix-turn-helix domain-containing protein [Chloroflexi bacterium]|nr:winged helix-turn-helix domain-containing protein [Chloroflexota bacterium]MBU1747247.1 winged helix-turn-helix domain-containing protein [Chloroflexota bacterium]MBU1878422.1 winged helix-turn-helix domain-containing protein [Chloroflexota bacterium]